MPTSRPATVRFWEKVDKNGPSRPNLGSCWVWTAAANEFGYGAFGVRKGLIVKAHRWAWEEANGPVPEGLELDHLCVNPRCVRPDYLEPVTHAENLRRCGVHQKIGAAARARTHCKRGHLFDEVNTYWHGGRRHCKACSHERQVRRRAAA